MSYNSITVIGNAGQDAELRITPQGKPVANFSVAVNSKYKDQETTLWLRVTAWDKLGELCQQYVTKGRQVLVEGRLEVREYTDKQGAKQKSVEIIARTVQFLGARTTAEKPTAEAIEADPSGGTY